MKLKLTIISAFITLILIVMFNINVMAQKGGDIEPIDDPIDLMREIRDTFQPSRAMLMAGAFEVLSMKSDGLHSLARMITTAFSKKALSSESRAKEEIWSDWKGFSQKAREFSDAVAELRTASKASDAQKAEGSIKKTLMACKNCHRAFRKPKAKAEDEYQ